MLVLREDDAFFGAIQLFSFPATCLGDSDAWVACALHQGNANTSKISPKLMIQLKQS